MDEIARGTQWTRCADGDLRGALGVLAPQRRRILELPRTGPCHGRVSARLGVHPCRTHAHNRASVLRLMGIPNHRLLRTDGPLRHAAGFDVLRRLSSSKGNRRDTRLGTLALSGRCAWIGRFRRHAPVRACRFAPRISPGMEFSHFQLWPQRSTQLSDFIRIILVRKISYRRHTGGCGRIDAISRLRPPAG